MAAAPEKIVSSFSQYKSTQIAELLADPDFNGCLPSLTDLQLDSPSVLVPLASSFSVAPISGFHVGAVALGASGRLYLGANMEFVGMPLNASLHAEQSAVLNAWMHGESAVKAIHVSALPCGHCRQFLCELPARESLIIQVNEEIYPFPELLPNPFGDAPRSNSSLLGNQQNAINAVVTSDDVFYQRAINAAERSYVPYSNVPEGFAIECSDGHTYAGRAAESVAFNPSVPSILCALNLRNFSQSRSYSINRCAQTKLVTTLNTNLEFSRALLRGLTNIKLETVLIETSFKKAT